MLEAFDPPEISTSLIPAPVTKDDPGRRNTWHLPRQFGMNSTNWRFTQKGPMFTPTRVKKREQRMFLHSRSTFRTPPDNCPLARRALAGPTTAQNGASCASSWLQKSNTMASPLGKDPAFTTLAQCERPSLFLSICQRKYPAQ